MTLTIWKIDSKVKICEGREYKSMCETICYRKTKMWHEKTARTHRCMHLAVLYTLYLILKTVERLKSVSVK